MTRLTNFQNDWLPKIDNQLNLDLEKVSSDDHVVAMLKYAVLNGGKRLRPLLTLAIVDSFDQKITPSILKAATAVEWVHSYSLVHDDLPAMDNDLIRRGQPSVHARFGEAEAILVGDALLTGAFDVVVTANDNANENEAIGSDELLAMVQNLSHQAGGSGMVLGQVHDMQNHNAQGASDKDWLINDVYVPKTAALLQYAALSGGRLAYFSETVEHTQTNQDLFNIGRHFGIAFQIQDDLDDFDQDDQEDVGSLPHLIGVAAARQQRDQYLAKAGQLLTEVSKRETSFDRTLLDDFLNLIGDKI
ncbi:polyprenyl synthetase family protein [Leuconostoc carnosum]|uniref:polyprenyl synthetase family protein n=1 Tax=Leuconostoc TaxID=1243 RepID=UPI000D50872A|nr:MULTISPECIES: polyprenyl synthetase family protein [Leuconostoc]KAA8325577.1 polyprenyl synthetase family protein [Leuconostoc carnosum]KAA8359799.1 polyprenyl synthetase family protein [Leuconostoc carnosum]KAA8365374.1 polyprenyl synthetase family protein [Leuconostoc carnosum]KAA8367743.1 polyprenyl synthetase family protein [Leuconostoc carnosum]KAA8374420.1 polyprenyl synthetase family protein [Leuconostoc carnosum]